MIKRLEFKKGIRVLGVQWTGTNITKVLGFCRYCHYSDGVMYIAVRSKLVALNPKDWIIKVSANNYIVISNNDYDVLFNRNAEDYDEVKNDAEVGA